MELERFLAEEVPAIAQRQRRWLPGTLTVEDVEQEMWAAACKRAEELEEHWQAGRQEAVRKILQATAKWAMRAEEREQRAKKALAGGYHTYDEEFYSLPRLRRALPLWVDWVLAGGEPTHESCFWDSLAGAWRVVEPGNDWHTILIDLDRAMAAVRPYHRKLLQRYFSFPVQYGIENNGTIERRGWTHAEIASAMGAEPKALASRVHHALRAVQKELGGQNPWNKGPTPRKGSK